MKNGKKRPSLYELRNMFRENGIKSSYTEYKGIYSPLQEAVYVWGTDEDKRKAAKIATEYGYEVKKKETGIDHRWMIY